MVIVAIGDDEVASTERYSDWFSFWYSAEMSECDGYGASTSATGESFARTALPNTHTEVGRGELFDDFGIHAVGE